MTEEERALINTVRFVVVAPDGRRSAEWRVFTGNGKKVTDELYLAPRKRTGEFKYSLHSSNYAQLGYVKRAREALRPGDQEAIERWELPQTEILSYWRVALCIWFPESELREITDGSLSTSTVKIPAAPAGKATAVMALLGTDAASTDGLDLIAVLDRASGGQVALVHLPIDIDPLLVPALHAREASRIPLQIPDFEPTEPFAWELVPGKDGSRLVVEFAPPERGTALPPLPPFRGAVLPWTEVPEQFWDLIPAQHHDFHLACGLLVYGPNDTSRLYVDQHARCDHTTLGTECQRVCDAVDRGGADTIWSLLPTGERYRIISTRRVLEAAGIDPNNPRLPTTTPQPPDRVGTGGGPRTWWNRARQLLAGPTHPSPQRLADHATREAKGRG